MDSRMIDCSLDGMPKCPTRPCLLAKISNPWWIVLVARVDAAVSLPSQQMNPSRDKVATSSGRSTDANRGTMVPISGAYSSAGAPISSKPNWIGLVDRALHRGNQHLVARFHGVLRSVV
jgi:hypothetical protein